jgi:hypothetical protein
VKWSIVHLILVAWVFPGESTAWAEQPECEPPSLEAEAVKDRLKRWDGLTAFSRWRIIQAKLGSCVRNELVLAHLQIAPPEKWSIHNLPYRVWLTIPVEADSGKPANKAPAAWKDLALGVKRVVSRVERYEDLRRFIERFSVVSAAIDKTPEGGHYRVVLTGGVLPGQVQPRVPTIIYDETAADRITAYRIPHMDSLPVRRELLRMVEVLSQHHPRCRPSWIDARRIQVPGPEAEPVRWTFQMELQGAGCPAAYAAKLEPDGAVARVPSGELTAKGDGGGVP